MNTLNTHTLNKENTVYSNHTMSAFISRLFALMMALAIAYASAPASASTAFISNFSGGKGLVAYDTVTHASTTVATIASDLSTTLGSDLNGDGRPDLFAFGGGTGGVINRYSPVSPFSLVGTFGSSIAGNSRGMAYSASADSGAGLIFVGGSGTSKVAEYVASGGSVGTHFGDITSTQMTDPSHILSPTGTTHPLTAPVGVAVDAAGNLWIIDGEGVNGNNLYEYNPSTSTGVLIYHEAGSASFNRVTIGPDGTTIYFTDPVNSDVEYWNGSIHSLTGGLFNSPGGIGFDPDTGNLYVGNNGNSTLIYTADNGATWQYATNLGTGNTVLNTPLDITFFAVPEPASFSLLAVGGLLTLRRRAR